MIPQYRHVILDFDGTLADTFPWFSSTINIAAEKFHFRQVKAGEIHELRTMDAKSIMHSLQVRWWKVPAISRFMRAHMASHLDSINLFPGVAEMLKELSEQGIKIGIVSSNSLENIRKILPSDCLPFITYFACGASLFKKKKKFLRLMKQAKVNPADTLSIGDESRDLVASREAGIDFGAVSWGYATGESLRLKGATYVFQNTADIVKLIK